MRYAPFLKNQTVQVGPYDKAKINLFGNAFQKTLNSENCFGPGLTKFIDLNTDFLGLQGVGGPMHATDNGRIFTMATVTTGVVSIALYTFNYSTGAHAPAGRIAPRD